MNPEIAVAILGVAGSIVVAYITSRATRPKVNAEATAATTGGEVAISGDAREWAKTFAERADRAESKAQAAEERADAAEAAVDEVRTRCDEAIAAVNKRVAARDQKINDLVAYVFTLQRQVRMAGEVPADPPASLRPPL
jgi:hypothetical protein